MRLKQLTVIPITLLVLGCSNSGSNYSPIIDGPVGPNYSNDLAQCQQLSQQQGILDEGSVGTAATTAGVAGATSVIFNGNSDDLGEAVAAGAIAGLASDAVRNNQQREVVIRNCMRGRGYNVIG